MTDVFASDTDELPPRRTRMKADERRASILDAALHIFSERGFQGATTAAIASESGITEPVLYHHFRNKADLYAACLDAAFEDLQARWDTALAAQPEARLWIPLLAEVGLQAIDDPHGSSRLWLNALASVTENPEVRAHTISFTIAIHDYIAQVVARAQAAGAVADRLDPDGEAWVFLAIGMLRATSSRLGGIADAAFPGILASRQAWYDTP